MFNELANAAPTPFEGFAVVDLETTGLSTKTDRVIELGVVLLNKKGDIEGCKETLFFPNQTIQSSTIHGITDNMVANAPTIKNFHSQLFTIFHNRILVAHQASFELKFLNSETDFAGVLLEEKNFIDTWLIAQKKFPPGSRNLKSISKHYGIPYLRPHQALNDAQVTAKILQNFMKEKDIRLDEFFVNVSPFWGTPPHNPHGNQHWYPRSLTQQNSY